MKAWIRALDRRLRARMGVFELRDDPDMLFRVRLVRATPPLRFPTRSLPPGSEVLELHFWNEHLPTLPAGGPDMIWGVRGQRRLAHSCRSLASHIREDPRLAGIEALVGSTVLFSPGDGSGAERVFERLGFTARPARNKLGRFGEFWGNFHAWLIMWAFNTVTVRQHRLLALRRTDFWADAAAFARRNERRGWRRESSASAGQPVRTTGIPPETSEAG